MFAALDTIEPPLRMLGVIASQSGGVQKGDKALTASMASFAVNAPR